MESKVLLGSIGFCFSHTDPIAPKCDSRHLGQGRPDDRYGCSRNPAERLGALSVPGLRKNPQMDTQ